MRQTIIVVVGVLSLGVFLFPTVAVPFSTDDVDTIEEIDDLVAVPSDGPGGEYATLVNTTDGDREIRLDLSANNGVSPGSVTTIDDVFEIAYSGDRATTVWLTSEVDGVQFYRSTNPDDSVEHQENSVTLSSNESVEIGVLVDTTGDGEVGGTHSFVIHADTEGDLGAGTGESGGQITDDSGDESLSQSGGDDGSATPQPEDDGAGDGSGPDDGGEEPGNEPDQPAVTPANGDPDTQSPPDEATTAPGQTNDGGEQPATAEGEEFDSAFGDVLGSTSQEVVILLSLLVGAMLTGATLSFVGRKLIAEP